MKAPHPSRREEIALFRLSVIGDLLAYDLRRGELKAELMARADRRYRPPGSTRTRRFHWKTLQRWYYLAKEDLDKLLPQSRAQGFALSLSDEQRQMLLQMRREHPSAAAELLWSEAVRHGIVADRQMSLSTLRRLYESEGLSRVSKRRAERNDVQRRRWRAANVGDLWHGDVCHLVLVDEAGQSWRALVHTLLDDASRYVPALQARLQEQEVDMLEVLCGALLRNPPPKKFYVDQGACYRGDVLALVCQRLGIHLVHALPGEPEGRGTQERFFRTMRQRCSDHLPLSASLHEVNQALWSWLDVDYHRRPHAGLLGQTPRGCYLDGLTRLRAPLSPLELARALEVTEHRRVRRDATFTLGGTVYEVVGRHLAGKRVAVVIDGLTNKPIRVSYKGRPVRFGLCDPIANSQRSRPAKGVEPQRTTPFDPIAALLQKAREEVDGE